MWKSSSDSCAWRRNASCSDTAKCHAFETFGSRPLASHGKRSAAMILYNDISISFAYISNEHSMVFASQKGARLGATAPVRCSALQGLLPCDSPRSWSMWLYQGSNPASGYSSWWVGSNHSSPGSWRVFSLNLIEIPKKMAHVWNWQFFPGATAAACNGWGLLGPIVYDRIMELIVFSVPGSSARKNSQSLRLAGNSRQNRC